MGLEEIECHKHFGGYNRRYQHDSTVLNCPMKFYVYWPPAAEDHDVPVLYFLSGLTCTDENFTEKTDAQRKASELGIALVVPDTSPPRLGIAGEEEWALGVGAGFYVDAVTERWKRYQMYSYISKELPELLANDPAFKDLDAGNASIFGHSMGGNGALMIALRNADAYKSASGFAPIANPVTSSLAQKGNGVVIFESLGFAPFKEYLGDDFERWRQYDATECAAKYAGPKKSILIDQGTSDPWLKDLAPDRFATTAAKNPNLDVELRWHDGYDHTLAFFVATFADDHITHHAKFLLKPRQDDFEDAAEELVQQAGRTCTVT